MPSVLYDGSRQMPRSHPPDRLEASVINSTDMFPQLTSHRTEDPAQVVLGMIEAVWNTRDHPNLGEVIAQHHTADFVDYSASPGMDRGLAGVEATVRQFLHACPDGRIETCGNIVNGDGVATFTHFVGTHEGDLPGVPATGREVYLVGVRADRVRDGRIFECRAGLGLSDLMRCLQSSPRVLRGRESRLSREHVAEFTPAGGGQAAARVLQLRVVSQFENERG